MITENILNAISDDFKSTFSLVDGNTITNLLFESETLEVESIIKRHLKGVQIEFVRTFQMSKSPYGKDIWIIRVNQSIGIR